MSLPVHHLRERLKKLIKSNKRGFMAALSSLSGVPDGTIHKIAYGKQKTVTYKVWKKLHEAVPKLPAPPAIHGDDSRPAMAVEPEKQRFIAALKHLFLTDGKFRTAEDLALSVGLKESGVKRLFKGDYSCVPNEQQKTVIAHAFGLSLKQFLDIGKRIITENKEGRIEDLFSNMDQATTTHPEIIQIVKMARKLDDKKIHALKEITLEMLISQINHE